MSAELVPIAQSLEAVATAAGSVIRGFRASGIAHRAKLDELRDQILFAQKLVQIDRHTALVSRSLDSMMAIYRQITAGHLEGFPLECAHEDLRRLVEQNRRFVEAYGRG